MAVASSKKSLAVGFSKRVLFAIMLLRLVAFRGVPKSVRPLSVLTDIAKAQLDAVKAAGTYKKERVITSPQSSTIAVAGSAGQVLNFCANNYLGLASHPEIVNAAHHALDTHGFGLSSVRCVSWLFVCQDAGPALIC